MKTTQTRISEFLLISETMKLKEQSKTIKETQFLASLQFMLLCSYLLQSCNHSKSLLWIYFQTCILNWENSQENLLLLLLLRPLLLWIKWSIKLMLSFLNLKIKLKRSSSPILTVKLVTFSPMMKIILRIEPNLFQLKKKKRNRKKIVKLDNQDNQKEETSMILNTTDKTLKKKLRKCLWNNSEKELITTLESLSELSE